MDISRENRFLVAAHQIVDGRRGKNINLAGPLEVGWGVTPSQMRSRRPISPPLHHPAGLTWEAAWKILWAQQYQLWGDIHKQIFTNYSL